MSLMESDALMEEMNLAQQQSSQIDNTVPQISNEKDKLLKNNQNENSNYSSPFSHQRKSEVHEGNK